MPLTILKTCVSISAMKHPHVTFAPSFPPPHPSTHPSPAVRLKHWRWSQLRQPWLLHGDDSDCRSLAINRQWLHPAQYCSKSSKIIMRTLRRIPSYSKMIKPRSLPLLIQSLDSILIQEFQNYHANIETHSLIFENDNTAISTPPYPKPGVSGNLLFQFLMICTTIMKLYKYVPNDVRQLFSLFILNQPILLSLMQIVQNFRFLNKC